MLDKKRIQEAETSVRSYLGDGLLTKKGFNNIVFKVLKANACDSLDVADFLMQNDKSDLWIIVASYYSMYYIANAVLYKLGYKVGDKISHKVTADALIVFVKDKLTQNILEEYEEEKEKALAGIKSDEVISSFDFERKKRNVIQYKTEEIEKHSKAKTSLERAKKFNAEMDKLLI